MLEPGPERPEHPLNKTPAVFGVNGRWGFNGPGTRLCRRLWLKRHVNWPKMTRVAGDPAPPPPSRAVVVRLRSSNLRDFARDFALSSPLFTVLYNVAAAPDLKRGAVGAHPESFGDAFGVHF